jgi:hypothetical protein
MTRKSKNKPKTAGRLKVIWGRRLPWTAFDGFDGLSLVASSVPHTRQRTASSLCRVPQVGHTIVDFEFFSGAMIFSEQAWLVAGPELGGLYQPFAAYEGNI